MCILLIALVALYVISFFIIVGTGIYDYMRSDGMKGPWEYPLNVAAFVCQLITIVGIALITLLTAIL